MGGAAAGEIASSLAVDEVLRLLEGRTEAGALAAVAEDAIGAANLAIYSRAQRSNKLSGMGTTLVSLVVEQNRAWVLNVGDSRCYRLRDRRLSQSELPQSSPNTSRLEQISVDHSLVEEQIRMGQMTRSEARRSPLKNIITRALGTQSQVTPDIFELETELGDLFLLCSDGLTRELADERIESILTADLPLEELCALLVKAANKAGGRDNITCLLVRNEG
jgi:protein phosphatase